MGGNTRAVDRETGELKTYAGKPAYAEKTNFKSIDRSLFKKHFVRMLQSLDDLHQRNFKEPIWDPRFRNSLLTSGEAFNGSSEHLFSDMSDDEFVKYKSEVGDIDLTVPYERLKTIFQLLSNLEGTEITPEITYIGQNKSKQEGHQINGLFAYEPEGVKKPIFIQVDFEGVEYDKGKPDEFAKFGHSSSWEDVKAGVKGVFHKYLLRSLAGGASQRDDVVLLTPASPLTPPEKIKIKKITSPIKLLSFSVDRGLRTNAKQQFLPDGSPVLVNSKLAFKEISTTESDYKRTRPEIYTLLFGKEPSSESDLQLLDSFVGILDLMKTHLSSSQIDSIFLDFLEDKLLGRQSQRLDANSAEVDKSVKLAAISKFVDNFDDLRKYQNLIDQLQSDYYSNYKTRTTVEGFIKEYFISLMSY